MFNTCVKRPLKPDKSKIVMTNGSSMNAKSIAECSPWSILQYFWPALSDNWSWNMFLKMVFENRFLVFLRVAVLHKFYCTRKAIQMGQMPYLFYFVRLASILCWRPTALLSIRWLPCPCDKYQCNIAWAGSNDSCHQENCDKRQSYQEFGVSCYQLHFLMDLAAQHLSMKTGLCNNKWFENSSEFC